MVNNFFDKIKEISISDMHQLGVLEIEEGVSEITTFHTHLYIIFDNIILKFESVNQYSKLSFQYIEDIKFDFEIEEDMIPVKNSIAEIVLNDTMTDNRVESLDIYGMETDSEENQICDALSFHLVCGQELFFDPTYMFGINIGGERQKNLWLRNYPNTSTTMVQKKSIKLI